MKTITTRTIVAAACGALMMSACTIAGDLDPLGTKTVVVASRTLKTDTRSVNGITGISLSSTGKVELEQGSSESLEIEAPDNVLPHLESSVSSGVLELRVKRGVVIRNADNITYRIKVKSLTSINVSGMGDISGKNIDTDALEINMSGLGSMSLAGRAKLQKASVSGAGSLDLANLTGDVGDISISGTGACKVNVASTLKASISGLGTVEYRGTPKVTKEISGGGSVSAVKP